jgi:hypothetical protein
MLKCARIIFGKLVNILRAGERTEDNITAVDQAQARLKRSEDGVLAAELAASKADGGPAQPPPAAPAAPQAALPPLLDRDGAAGSGLDWPGPHGG